MGSRDVKMRTWGGEPRANLLVFALLLAWVIVSWFYLLSLCPCWGARAEKASGAREQEFWREVP